LLKDEDKMNKLPRIERVAVRGPTTLRIKWRRGTTNDVDLASWIATGGEVLARLGHHDLFDKARVADHGAAVAWDNDDLRIDAAHLKQLALRPRKIT
jgi:hypothetical protein